MHTTYDKKHSVLDTVKMNKIALKKYDNKRIWSFNGIKTYPSGTSAFKVCHEEYN